MEARFHKKTQAVDLFFFSVESVARGDVRKVSIESAHVYFADVSKNPNRNSFPSDMESTTSNSPDIYI